VIPVSAVMKKVSDQVEKRRAPLTVLSQTKAPGEPVGAFLFIPAEMMSTQKLVKI